MTLQPLIFVQVADEVEVDDDAVNLITEEAQPAATVKTDASVRATSTEPTSQFGSALDQQGKEDSMTAPSTQNMQNMMNMMNMNPMFGGMDVASMMQMMSAGGMNLNGFNPMMGKSRHALL